MNNIIKHIISDILRSKIILVYTIILGMISFSLFLLDSNHIKSTLSLVNTNLIVIPLVSIIFTTIHYYNSYEFIQLLVSQPISRKTIILSEYLGAMLSLCIAFLTGVGIPVLIFTPVAKTG